MNSNSLKYIVFSYNKVKTIDLVNNIVDYKYLLAYHI
jgi:hypothetical protein